MSVGTNADIDLDGGLDLNVGLNGAVGVNLTGIPNSFELGVNKLPKLLLGLDKLLVGLDKVQIGLDKVQLGLDKVQLGIDPLALNLDIKPLDFALRLKELPSLRVHFPANFKLGFALFGSEFFSISLCGQGQVITEPYVPNPCERAVEEKKLPKK